jgi:hypothetical protein
VSHVGGASEQSDPVKQSDLFIGYTAVAKRMNITTRTVESYMFRAFNHIRTSYRG